MANRGDTRRRKARAAWAYSSKSQKAFATSADITYDRWRNLTGTRGPEPTLDELHGMADAAGMDRAFMADDFGGESASVNALRESVAQLVAETARHSIALAELQAWRRRQGSSAGGVGGGP